MHDFFEFAERQMETPAAEAGQYVSEFTVYAVSSGHPSPADALEEAMNDLHARAEELRAARQRAATGRGRHLRLSFGSPTHSLMQEPRRWWHPGDWFRPTLYVATIFTVFEAWETDMERPADDLP